MDVSFISARHIIPAVYSVLADGGIFVCLIKPQFEVGKSGLNKKGIVKNDTLRKQAVAEVIECATTFGFSNRGVIESPILGGDGNTEYLACFVK
jgi:23S rRNA (cytidine1920-2'-O)/16S rRNA (cytidine1409-2'-O)-methyltransferase